MRRSLRITGLRARLARFSIALALSAGAFLAAPFVSTARADDGGMMTFLLSGNAGSTRSAYVSVGPRLYYAPPREKFASVARKHPASRIVRLAKRHAPRATIAKMATVRSEKIASARREIYGPPAPTAAMLRGKAPAEVASDIHLRDQTLRRGDIIATAKGLRVFQGAEHFPYRASDFVALARVTKLQNHAMLAAIDNAILGKRPATTATRQASLAPARAVVRTVASRAAPRARPLAYAPAPRAVPRSTAIRAIERAIGDPRATFRTAPRLTPEASAFERLLVSVGHDVIQRN